MNICHSSLGTANRRVRRNLIIWHFLCLEWGNHQRRSLSSYESVHRLSCVAQTTLCGGRKSGASSAVETPWLRSLPFPRAWLRTWTIKRAGPSQPNLGWPSGPSSSWTLSSWALPEACTPQSVFPSAHSQGPSISWGTSDSLNSGSPVCDREWCHWLTEEGPSSWNLSSLSSDASLSQVTI